ncbi:MAG: hypothetical protein NUV46_00605 [Nanoarchaeota archaeon]|nr:hypothetical protein [Nanoarchaeota archaeon]
MKTTELMFELFVIRNDAYARQFLQPNGKKGFKCVKEPLSSELIESHLNQTDFLGTYNLNLQNEVIWGVCDFDKNTEEDFENAKKLYLFLKEKGFNPLFEMSGGGDYKAHIWIFSQEPIPASQMKEFLEMVCEKSGVQPHEIFPKQTELEEEGFGNLVKLPLGKHLVTQRRSIFLNDSFEELNDFKGLLLHLKNKDKIPVIKKEKPLTQDVEFKTKNTHEWDTFFNLVLKNELPEGITKEVKIGNQEAGINNNILKNEARWLFEKGYTLEDLKKEIQPIFKQNKWVFTDLLGWFKKCQKGDILEINRKEIQKWCEAFYPSLKTFIPQKENSQNEEQIKSFLVEGRQKYESLGCGFNNGVYYFGTKLFKEGKPHTALVTSDKKLYIKKEFFYMDDEGKQRKKVTDEIKKDFGLNYKDDFYDEGLENILTKEVINKWLYEDCSEITIKKIYEELISVFKKYIYFEDQRKYSLLACYRIAGFFMPIWRARARLFPYAEMGSAKSRLTQIMHNTGFNSIALGDWTLPYLQRLIESTRGETHIDDFETLPEEQKNATIRLVKVGFMKGFKAGKISDGKNKKPETYDLFNTTTLNNTQGLDFISTDRCITIRIPKISKKEYDKEPNFTEHFWKNLRDNLYVLGLKYPQEVSKTYEEITSNKIRGRLFFIIKPELTIAKLISESVFSEIEDFWIEEISQRETIDFETDWEFNALKQVYKVLSTLSTNTTLTTLSTLSTTDNYFSLLKDIVEPVGLNLYDSEEFKKRKRSMSIIIGNSLKRSPIFKSRKVKGVTQYKVDLKDFESLLEAKGFLKQIKEIEGEEVDSVEWEEGGRMIKALKTEKKPEFEVVKIGGNFK